MEISSKAQSLMCLATILLWGINPILTRLCSNMVGIQPYMVVTTIMSSVCTIIINSVMRNNLWHDIGTKMFQSHPDLWKRWLISIIDSTLCLSVPSVLYNIMLSNTQSIAIIVTTTWYGAPILTCILSTFIFHQPISRLQIGGIIVSVAGIVMMNIEDIISQNKNSIEEIEEIPLVHVPSSS